MPRKVYPIAFKLEVLGAYDLGKSMAAIKKQYGITKETVR